MRGVAILLVVLAHTRVDWFVAGGAVGVTMFFTLSGFLITSLLLTERQRTGRVSLAGFYRRRALRLFPALAAFLAVVAVATYTVAPGAVPVRSDFLMAAFYVANWTTAGSGRFLGAINHVWSLSVEEQFYIVWPLILVGMLAVGRRHAAVWVAAGGAVFAVVERLWLWEHGASVERIYYGTDTHMDALLVGCLAAMWLQGRRVRSRSPLVPTIMFTAAALLGFTSGAVEWLLVPTVVPVLTAVGIVHLVQGDYEGWLSGRWLRLAGERSYGLYLWHYPLIGWLAPLLPFHPVVSLTLTGAATVVAVALSWRFVEQPFLRLKGRSVGAVEPAQREPDQGVVLAGERLHLGDDLRVRW